MSPKGSKRNREDDDERDGKKAAKDEKKDEKRLSSQSSATPPVPVADQASASTLAPSAPDSASTPVAKPIVPSAEEKYTDTLATMRGIIKYVKHRLPGELANHAQFVAGVGLHGQEPLTIRACGGAGSDDHTELMSYKHAWSADDAEVSLRGTGRYEAGGNLMWLNPFTTSKKHAEAAGPAPPWTTVHIMADMFRVEKALEVKGKVAKEKRLWFRTPFFVHASTLDALKKPPFPGTLDLINGHVALYGWYLAMFEALEASSREWMLALWQAGLTVSIHAQMLTSLGDLAALSMRASNELYGWSKACGESFPSFALKLSLISCELPADATVKTRLELVQAKGVRYKGTAVVRGLWLGAMRYVELVDASTHALFLKFETLHGKEVLTDKWNVMARILQTCSKAAETANMWSDGTSTSVLVAMVVHYLTWALKHEVVTPGAVTESWLDQKKDGTPGVVTMVLCKALLVSHISTTENQRRKKITVHLETFQFFKRHVEPAQYVHYISFCCHHISYMNGINSNDEFGVSGGAV